MIPKAARRYAKALLQSAVEQDILDEVQADMRFILNTEQDSKDLTVFLKSPVISPEVKKQALLAIFEKHLSKETLGLLRLLSEKHREGLLGDICRGFFNLYNEHQGILHVQVTAAFEPEEQQKKALIKELESSTGKKIKMDLTIDSSIQGGLIVRINDTVLDGSVKHKIRKLKKQFAADAAV
ncbi:MAG: ATP synthase F1 subunit delta [Balneolaceae bacterium]